MCFIITMSMITAAEQKQWWSAIFSPNVNDLVLNLQEKYGDDGQWIETDTHYKVIGALLGHRAEVEVIIQSIDDYQVIFTWQERDNLHHSKQYWRSLLHDLLGLYTSIDLFTGEYVWNLSSNLIMVWSHETKEEKVLKPADTLGGKMSGKGSIKRLYSIDKEEYESSYQITLDDVSIGRDEEILINVTTYRLMFQYKLLISGQESDGMDVVSEDISEVQDIIDTVNN